MCDRILPMLERKPPFLLVEEATAHYNKLQYDEAKVLLEEVRKVDPYRLDDMDTYSSILFVAESKAELSNLAHSAVRIDKYRAESNFIVGNYYSVKGKHEQAVTYFKRAIRLNPSYASAWILMGHEFLEMKNTDVGLCFI